MHDYVAFVASLRLLRLDMHGAKKKRQRRQFKSTLDTYRYVSLLSCCFCCQLMFTLRSLTQ
jgi:hypothetical protein